MIRMSCILLVIEVLRVILFWALSMRQVHRTTRYLT